MTNTIRRQDGSAEPRDGVAIIGMSCLFPGAPDVDTFWRNILNKVDAVSAPPPEAWDPAVYYDPEFSDTDKVYCQRGGYLGALATFDPLEYGIPPMSVGGEPDQWLALKLAYEAMADAGCLDLPEAVRHRTAIMLGKGTYLNGGNATVVQRSMVLGQTLDLIQKLMPDLEPVRLELLRDEMKRVLPPLGAETVAGLIPNIIVGRIANRLDLMGPTYTVDAACASSLVAIQLAMRDLLNGECDLAIAGGSQVWMPVGTMNVFCQLGALSRDEQIRPFDKDANGTLLGEGIGMVVLKRLADAERDGDRIYAVVRGVGVASDGRGVSVMAPRVDGEELALRRAYADAGISPDTIGLIEAHGTATAVGDVVEVQALTRVFGTRDAGLPRCALGTVKSMISHTIPASGVAGLIKTSLALYHKVLPPTLNVSEPNPKLELEKTHFYINTEPRPWVHGGVEPRRAGINSFGFGGINAHAIVEEYIPSSPVEEPLEHLPPWESEVVILRGDSTTALLARVAEVAARIERAISGDGTPPKLADVAYSLNTEDPRGGDTVRLAIVATSLDDLRKKLDRASSRLQDPGCRQIKDVSGIYYFSTPVGVDGKVVLLFPGEGAQYPNMLADLCLHFPEVRSVFDRYDRIFFDHPRGDVPSDFIFPRPAFSDEERRRAEERLMQMDVAIEAVQAANQAMFALVESLELQADACVGHSSGEYSAAGAAGVFDVDTDERFIAFGRALHAYYAEANAQNDVPKAVLLAIGAPREQVEAIAREAGGEIFLAVDNCPHQAILVGTVEAAERAKAIVEREGLIYERLAYDRAVHTPLFEPYIADLRRLYDAVDVRPARIPLYSCATAERYPDDPEQIRALFLEHWARPVEFRRTIESLYDDGARVFVEVGPRGNLSAFVEDILRGRPACVVPANVMRRSGITQLNHLVGILSAHGVSLNISRLYAHRVVERVDWDDERPHARRSGGVKLSTTWPMVRLSDEVVEQFRGPSAAPAGVNHREAQPPGADDRQQSEGEVAPIDDAVPQPWAPGLPPDDRMASSNEQVIASPDEVSAILASHLDIMDQFLVSQQEIMEAFLYGSDGPSEERPTPGAPNGDWHGDPHEAETPRHPLSSHPEPNGHTARGNGGQPAVAGEDQMMAVLEERSPAAAVSVPETRSVGVARSDRDAVRARLLGIVADRTGYPAEMLDEQLDMEADLGIDSIKRVEIIGSYRARYGDIDEHLIERLAEQRSLGAIVDLLSMPSPSSDSGDPVAARRQRDYPLLGTIVSWEPGRELVAERTFDLAHDRYLRDHTLGRDISAFDPDLTALAVMPLTMSLEIIAEAAACLVPGATVVGMRDVRAGRWLAFEDDPQTVRTRATVIEPGRVEVRLWNLDERGPDGEPISAPVVEATVLFADRYPQPSSRRVSRPTDPRASRWETSHLYTDVMFHGPSWQGVSAIAETGSDGIVARLAVLPTDDFIAGNDEPDFVLDPVVLDAAGQVIGYWTTEHLSTGRVIFPFRLAALDIFGPRRPAGEDVTCVASISLIGESLVRSDIDVVANDGSLWMRLEGWEDKRFDVPDHLHALILSKPDTTVSSEWAAPVPAAARDRVMVRLVDTTVQADQAFWKRVWSRRILSASERNRFATLTSPDRRQLEWLGARTAAKEAVQVLVRRHAGLELQPADIDIAAGAEGQPLVQGGWLSTLPVAPVVSLAHTGGLAVAAVALPGESGPVRIGIDIERLTDRPAGFADVAFDAGERSLIAAARGDLTEWTLRAWCAKEAAAKMLGTGLVEGPGSIVIVAIDDDSGVVSVEVRGKLASELPDGAGRWVTIDTMRHNEIICALALDGSTSS